MKLFLFIKANLLGLELHIERLERSAAMLDINIDINLCAQEIILLKERSQFPSGYIYYQVSRGIDQKRSHISLVVEFLKHSVLPSPISFNNQPLR